MLNDEQIARIDAEAIRLENRKVEIKECLNYAPILKQALEDFINGELDALKWAKETL